MVALAARACLMLGLWVNGARGAADEGDASIHCSKFGLTVSVCTKRTVMGVVGGSVLLPCNFSLRSPSNQVSVEWRLREVNKGAVIFNSSNNNYTDYNFRDRLRLLGDPGKGDASILIGNLKRADINTYFCRIKEWEMSEKRKKEIMYYGHHGTRLLVKDSEGDESLLCSNFSDMASVCTKRIVKGVAGGSALLPCTFSLHSLSHQVHVEWRLQEVNKGLLIFNSSNNYIEGNFQNRLRLVGDPTNGEGSISITNLKCSDTNVYLCHIKELKMNQQGNSEYNYADQHGTLLVVDDVPVEANLTTASNSTSSIMVAMISFGSISLGAVIACVVQMALRARALKRPSLAMVARETPITYDAVLVESISSTSEDKNNFQTYSNVIYSTVIN